MIISRTPFRISFVGGGTDLRAFYQKEFGQVLRTTINKFIYVPVNSGGTSPAKYVDQIYLKIKELGYIKR